MQGAQEADQAAGRRAVPGGAPAAPVLVASEIYRRSTYGGAHPLRIPRVSTVLDLCRAMGWLPAARYATAPRAKAAVLTAWHSPDYVAALTRAEATGTVPDPVRKRHHLGTLSNPVFPEMFRRPATGAGGMMLAAELVRDGGIVHVPGGGTHHGMPDRAAGFCYLNDVVLGILALKRLGLGRVAYVDIDAHHGDGVEHAFAADPEVLLISVHEEDRWPFTGLLHDRGCGNVFNMPVPRGFNDSEMREVIARLIVPRVAAHGAQAIVLQCGADAVLEDPLSRLALSNNAHRAVLAALRGLAPRMVVTGGGGYNPWTVGRAWACIWADIAGHAVPDRLPAEAAQVLAGLAWSRRPPPAPDLLTTLADPPREGPVRAAVRERLEVLGQR